MKHSSRCLSLILLAAMLGGTVACGGGTSQDETTGGEGNTENTTTAETASDRLTELGSHDFGGASFTILDANNMPTIHQNIPNDELTGDIINDALTERNAKIEEMYKCEVVCEQVTDGGAALFKNSVLAGDKSYDMIISVINGSIGPLATDGILADLCAIDSLTLDAEWWSPLIYESLQIGGKMYYTSGDISPAIYCAPACYFVNKKLVSDYQIPVDDLYSAVEDGKWTMDYLYKVAGDLGADLNNDDTINVDDDFFGILSGNDNLTAAVFSVGSGVKLTETDKNGNLICDLGKERTIKVFEKLHDTLGRVAVSSNANQQHDAFKNDRAIFFMHYVSSAYTRYRDNKSDFMIMPIPKYDESQSTYYSYVNTWANAFVGVPVNADTERAGVIMEAMAYLSHENLRPYVYDIAFKNKGARNEKDAEMLDVIFDTLYLDFNFSENFGGSLGIIGSAIFGEGNFASAYASAKDSINTAIETFSKTWTKSE